MLYFLLKIEQFHFLRFSSCLTSEDYRDRAVPYLKNDSSGDFSILNNLSLRRNIYLNIRKFTRENKPLLAKVNSKCFFLFPAAMLVPLIETPTWRLHAKLYKFVWNILSNNSCTEYRTDLTLGQIPYIFNIYNMSIS